MVIVKAFFYNAVSKDRHGNAAWFSGVIDAEDIRDAYCKITSEIKKKRPNDEIHVRQLNN